MQKNKTDKVVLNMKMPELCGKCKFGMKTCKGKDFCFITRKVISVDSKSPDCPLTEYPSARKNTRVKKLPCKYCKHTRSSGVVLSTTGPDKFFKCCKCGADSSSNPGATWREAAINWNIVNSIGGVE